MSTFQKFYESYNLKFDLVNPKDLQQDLQIFIRMRLYLTLSRLQDVDINLVETFQRTLSKLLTKEVIKGMNKYGFYDPKRVRGSTPDQRAEQERRRVISPYFETMRSDDSDTVEVFLKVTDIPAYLETDYFVFWAPLKKELQNLKKSDWMVDESGRWRDNLYYYIESGHGYIDSTDRVVSAIDMLISFTSFAEINNRYINGRPVATLAHFAHFILDRRLSKELAQKSHIKYAHSAAGVIEYFLKSPTLQTISRMLTDYDKLIAVSDKDNIDTSIMDNSLPVHKWSNGLVMLQPLTTDVCKSLGATMHHCVGGYDPLNPQSIILQLYDANNGKSIATVELSPDDFFNYNNHLNARVYNVEQIKGKMNQAVASEYKRYMEEFFKTYTTPATGHKGRPLGIKTRQGDMAIYINKPKNVLYENTYGN